MSTEGCKLGVIEMLGKTKMGKSKVDELTTHLVVYLCHRLTL
jgi:tartrate dehydratase beta subunit/fumarate hydratase class I family protein